MAPPDDWPPQLPAAFYDGLGQLNRGDYYACHETLEALWIPEKRGVRELYQGVLQIAVGCFHLTVRANRRGAISKLDAGARRLERALSSQDVAQRYGVDWAGLIAAADRLHAHLRDLAPDRLGDFDRALLPVAACPLRPPLLGAEGALFPDT